MLNIWFRVGAAFMLVGIAMGSFGAHFLKARLTPEALHTYHIGSFYHLLHGLAICLVGLAISQYSGNFRLRLAGWAFVLGIFVFSGSLYLLALTGTRWLGALTPIGGVLFMLGWLLLVLA